MVFIAEVEIEAGPFGIIVPFVLWNLVMIKHSSDVSKRVRIGVHEVFLLITRKLYNTRNMGYCGMDGKVFQRVMGFGHLAMIPDRRLTVKFRKNRIITC